MHTINTMPHKHSDRTRLHISRVLSCLRVVFTQQSQLVLTHRAPPQNLTPKTYSNQTFPKALKRPPAGVLEAPPLSILPSASLRLLSLWSRCSNPRAKSQSCLHRAQIARIPPKSCKVSNRISESRACDLNSESQRQGLHIASILQCALRIANHNNCNQTAQFQQFHIHP